MVDTITCDLNQQNLNSILQNTLLAKLVAFWSNFLEYIHHNNGDLSAYWMSYIDMVENALLGLLRSSREGN